MYKMTARQNPPSISIDTRNMYTSQVGAEGIAPEEFNAIRHRLAELHAELAAKSAGGLSAEFACLNLASEMQPEIPAIMEMAATIGRYRNVILIGIGGSSLGAKAIRHALKPEHESPDGSKLYFVENVDPYHMEYMLSLLAPEQTALVCVSKSGGTIETVVQYQILREWLARHLGADQAKRQQWLITDPQHGWLRDLANRQGIPHLPVPPNVGGRYSVLSAVGLLPLAVIGVDIEALLRGAADMSSLCASGQAEENPALEMAALHYLLDVKKDKRISVMMPYVNRLRLFVDWYCQLWAESLGKWNVTDPTRPPAGTLPVRAMGAVDQHSQLQMYLESRHDKMFTFIDLLHWDHDMAIPLDPDDLDAFPYLVDKTLVDVISAEFRATRQVITDTGHPNMTLHLPELNAYTLGQLVELYQRTTVYAGMLYGINPLDQPSVEKGKKLAIQYLQRGSD